MLSQGVRTKHSAECSLQRNAFDWAALELRPGALVRLLLKPKGNSYRPCHCSRLSVASAEFALQQMLSEELLASANMQLRSTTALEWRALLSQAGFGALFRCHEAATDEAPATREAPSTAEPGSAHTDLGPPRAECTLETTSMALMAALSLRVRQLVQQQVSELAVLPPDVEALASSYVV